MKSISRILKGNPTVTESTVYYVLVICCISHFLNDMIQSIIPSIYPILKDKFDFSFAQIGIITLVFQMTSSILQPFTGLSADRHPRPYALSVGMCFTLAGLLMLSFAENYLLILLAVSVVGFGSSMFHPTASRVAQLASGGKKSLAQSIFQVGGNGGSALGPLLAALIILPFGQHAISWFAIAALLAALIMVRLGAWYKARLQYAVKHPRKAEVLNTHISRRAKYGALLILILHHELLHVLPHRQVRRLGAGFADMPLRVPRRLRHRHARRRRVWRPLRTQVRDMVLHPWCGSVRHRHALRQSDVDHCVHLPLGTHHRLGVLLDSGLRHRPHARQSRTHRRHFLRSYVRTGWHRFGVLRMARRQDQRGVHLQSERLPAAARHNRRTAARYAEEVVLLNSPIHFSYIFDTSKIHFSCIFEALKLHFSYKQVNAVNRHEKDNTSYRYGVRCLRRQRREYAP